MKNHLVNPSHFPKPRGYTNGVVCEPGRTLFVAGQVAFDKDARIVSPDFATQFLAALDNVIAVVRSAGGGTQNIVKLLIFVTDLDKYRDAQRDIGEGWRARMGDYWPAMSLVKVAGLLEPGALRGDRGHRRAAARADSMKSAARSHARDSESTATIGVSPLGTATRCAQPHARGGSPPARGGVHDAAIRFARHPGA